MLTTAKSLQILDASGLNISPITDITSLYYEVTNPNDNSIISRKFVYSGFPVGVDIQEGQEVNYGPSPASNRGNLTLYDNSGLKKIVDNTQKKDILVSNVSVNIIPGTTYREIAVNNYNLSEMLLNYTPLDLMDSSYNNVSTNLHQIENIANNLNSEIDDISTALHADSMKLRDLVDLANRYELIQNKFYIVNDYCVNNDGCMDIPENTTQYIYGGLTSPYKLLVKASTANTLDNKLYAMYDNNNNSLNVYGKYDIIERGARSYIRITYLKDQFGNEAMYDFYNIKVKIQNSSYYQFFYTFSNSEDNLLPANGNVIKNNIIKVDPYNSQCHIPLFIICGGTCEYINNFIGISNNIELLAGSMFLNNNIIKNDNTITYFSDNATLKIFNSLIETNNNLNITYTGSGDYCETIINQLIVKNNNTIEYENQSNDDIESKNIIIGSSNNITLKINDNININILDNCNSTITCQNNIIVSDCTLSSFSPQANSAYLFNQNIYAKSFNTI